MKTAELKKLKDLQREKDYAGALNLLSEKAPHVKITQVADRAATALAVYQRALAKYQPEHSILQRSIAELSDPEILAAEVLATVHPSLDRVYAQKP